jgi:hypothetical protein
VLCTFQARSATIGYWRMEQDLDPSAEGLQVANEVAGNDLFSSTAFIDANLPTTSVPLTGSSNIGSIGVCCSVLCSRWWVDDGAKGASALQMANVFDMDENWHHFAFTYDHTSGLGEFFVDAAKVAEQQGVAGRGIVWDPGASLEIGLRMDYAAAFNGTMDEVRLDDVSLAPGDLLLTPEPSTILLMGMGLLGLGVGGRARR